MEINDDQRRKQRSNEKKMLKLRIVWCVTKTQIETEKKTLSRVLKVKEFVAFINLPYDFS